jgi:hypothetical protein
MGWFIKQKKNKWKIHSTITDSIIASFNSQKECVNFIALEEIYNGKKKAIETLMQFPHDWTVNGSRYVSENENVYDQYYNWINSINNINSYEEYYKKIDEKLDELLNK